MTNADRRRHGTHPLIDHGDLVTLINGGVLNAVDTELTGGPFYCAGWAGAWVYLSIDSTNSPTNVRFLAQFRGAAGDVNDWADFEEGLWASLYFEDTSTADGVIKAFNLPFGGNEALRIRAIGDGTDADNTFTITVRIRPYRPAVGMAHA